MAVGVGVEEHSGDAPAIQTVQRAATILKAFSAERPRLTLAELTADLAISRATAHRYARALRAANLLRFDTATATYTLGPQILAMEAAARAALPIVTAAEPHLDRLTRLTNQTSVLSVWNGESPIVVRCMDNVSGDVRLSVRTGSPLDLVRSAQGRVFCAFLPPAEAPVVARQLRLSAGLRAVVEQVRRDGFAVNSPEDFGVRVLAAPVFERTAVVAALGVLGTDAVLSGAAEAAAADALLRIARELSEGLGAAVG
ncbi:IclR family transcriptional regulator [Micromonospora carbonacea]|uniref:IclR family transcriptional regulator n=1 Tax=Micromonospora carbonacea TaxID=47853 RepID=A0A1C5ANP6_9ACTN|nr:MULTISPECIES: IclR family transcriptional regulator [Micromonospora]MBB5827193.1 IclR family pca regulon transcriptional regulator [Micromonospora carbonacea]QLD25011.1 IclR family transcriptional regulator [Micromonospora carbonacea]WFE55379.1 IclR family transcriptional regulator [Micromonospora sp. WMMD712]SCF46691.1 transcriptional regulator, IclR family [Micromonospora carbonacea]